jgi:hypothetical protein
MHGTELSSLAHCWDVVNSIASIFLRKSQALAVCLDEMSRSLAEPAAIVPTWRFSDVYSFCLFRPELLA